MGFTPCSLKLRVVTHRMRAAPVRPRRPECNAVRMEEGKPDSLFLEGGQLAYPCIRAIFHGSSSSPLLRAHLSRLLRSVANADGWKASRPQRAAGYSYIGRHLARHISSQGYGRRATRLSNRVPQGFNRHPRLSQGSLKIMIAIRPQGRLTPLLIGACRAAAVTVSRSSVMICASPP